MKTSGSTAVVTGAASGLGRGIALALAEAGCDVLAVDIDLAGAQATAKLIAEKGRKSAALQCNVAEPAAVEAMAQRAFETFPALSFVFNNAGVVATGLAVDTSAQDLQWTFSVNALGVWHGSMAFTRRFLALNRRAWICNTASENGLAAASIGTAAYSATKHAVIGMTDAFRTEYAGRVGFSVICPGIVRTNMWNAGRNRPAEFGGEFKGDPLNEKAMSYGMDPLEAGRLVVAAVESEAFFVFTHRHVRDVAESRWKQIAEDIDRQLPEGKVARQRSTVEIQQMVMAGHE